MRACLLTASVALLLGLVSTPATAADFRWVLAEEGSVMLVDTASITVVGDVRGFDFYMAAERTPVAYGKGHLEADCVAKRTRMLSHGKLNAAGGFDDVAETRIRWANPAREDSELRMIGLACAKPADRDRWAPSITGDWRTALDTARAKAAKGQTPKTTPLPGDGSAP